MDAKGQLALVERNLTDEQIKEKAGLFIKSGFLPPSIKTVEQAMTIILTGRELGLGLMESLRSINVIQGKPALSAQLMLALCQQKPDFEDIKIEEKQGSCTTQVKRKDRSWFTYTFTSEDAKALGLSGKDNWIKQPKTMLRWRSISGCLRVAYADAICGLYTEDEAEDIIHTSVELKQEKDKEAIETLADPAELDHENLHNEQSNLDMLDKIGASFIQDQAFYKGYPDKTIAEIYQDKLPSGDPRGKKYLRLVTEKSRNETDRVNIAKYLELMDSQGVK